MTAQGEQREDGSKNTGWTLFYLFFGLCLDLNLVGLILDSVALTTSLVCLARPVRRVSNEATLHDAEKTYVLHQLCQVWVYITGF